MAMNDILTKVLGSSTTTAAVPRESSAPPIDVAKVLDNLVQQSGERLDWKHSIVDLLKAVGEDSSLSARKQLARDLGYSGDMDNSASINIWLHKHVMQKIADAGGKVPDEVKP